MANVFKKGMLRGYEIPKRLSQEEKRAANKIKVLSDTLIRREKSKQNDAKRKKRNARIIKLAQISPPLSEADRYAISKSSSGAQDLPKAKIKAWQGGSCTPK